MQNMHNDGGGGGGKTSKGLGSASSGPYVYFLFSAVNDHKNAFLSNAF